MSHRIPYPPNKGDKIRSWNFLSRLAKHHTVHAGFFLDDGKDKKHIQKLNDLLASVCAVSVNPFIQKILGLRAFFRGGSLTEYSYPTGKLKKYCNGLLLQGKIDVVFVFSAAPIKLVDDRFSGEIVVDLVDVDSEKWRAYSKTSTWPLSKIFAREAKNLAVLEAKIVSRSERTLLVSEEEAGLLRKANPGMEEKIIGISNGVDTSFFDPRSYTREPRSNSLLFTGALDYQPNIEAVVWFCDKIWPEIRAVHRDVVFYIAGSSPVSQILDLARLNGVNVLSDVPDMAEIIASAHIVVAPLRTARGIQNKVLEALAMAKPTVTTSVANVGVNGVPGEHLMVADTAAEFAAAVNLLLNDTSKCADLGLAARPFVEQNFSWDKSFEQLNAIISRTS